MRRLNDAELNARIHKFLYRKFSEHPELSEDEDQLEVKAVSPRLGTLRVI